MTTTTMAMTMMRRMLSVMTISFLASSHVVCNAARFSSGGKKVEYYRNHPLTGSPDFTRAVVVIHGNGRNADDYYNSVMEAKDVFPGVGDNTLVIAPRFQSEDDAPAADELYWSVGGWSRGDNSLDGAGYSSFSVADGLLESISSRFPNVTELVIAGHGAGAQFVQRYAGMGAVLDIRCDMKVRYVISNPGSYMWPTSQRPASTSGCDNGGLFGGEEYTEYITGEQGIDECPSGTMIITDPVICNDAAINIGVQYLEYANDVDESNESTPLCVYKNIGKSNERVTITNKHGSSAAWVCEGSAPSSGTYDKYKYGISDVPTVLPYASSLSTSDIQQNLVDRTVFLLLGTGDNSRTNGPQPDQSCEADSQGQHRFERGLNYRDSIKALSCGAQTTVTTVLDIDHDHNGMFVSPQGVMALFIG